MVGRWKIHRMHRYFLAGLVVGLVVGLFVGFLMAIGLLWLLGY